MATVDELVVKLTLDNAEFRRSIDGMQEQLRKFSGEASRHTGAVETATQRTADGFTKLRNEVLGLLAAFVSVSAIVDFTKRITEMDLALGRAASASGIFIGQFGAWQGAARAMGGPADTFTKALNNIQSAIGAYHAGEQSPFLAMMERMQVQVATTKDGVVDLEETMKRIADWASAQTDIPGRNFALGRLGFSPDDIALIIRGREEMQKYFDIARRYQATPADNAAAHERNLAMYEFGAAIDQIGRTILTELSPALTNIARQMITWIAQNREWIQQDIIGVMRSVVTTIGSMITAINKAVEALGGWQRVAEVAFGLWLTDRIAAIAGLSGIGAITTSIMTANGAALTFLGSVNLVMGALKVMGAVAAANLWFRSTQEERLKQLGFQRKEETWHGLGATFQYMNPQTGETIDFQEAQRRAGITPGGSLMQQFGEVTRPFGSNATPGGAGLPVADTTMNPTRRAFLETLAAGESTDYTSRNPAPPFAYGRYQFIPSTREQAQRETGITGYDPASQDRLGWYWADKTYRRNTGRDLEEDFKAGRHAEITAALRGQWPSVPGGKEQNTTAEQWRMRAEAALGRNGQTPSPTVAPSTFTDQFIRQRDDAWAKRQLGDRTTEEDTRPTTVPWWQRMLNNAPMAPPPDPSLRGALHPSSFQGGSSVSNNDNSRTATTNINGPITINTQANDADGIARGLRAAVARNSLVAQSDYGIA